MNNHSENNSFALWLHEIPGLGAETIRKLQKKQPDMNISEILYTAQEKELRELCASCMSPVRAEKTVRQVLENRRTDPDRRARRLEEQGICFCSMEDKEYPERLREIPDPPYGIYYKGKLPSENVPSAAIIGARLASSYGRDQAVRFGSALSEAGIQVISGMARGIDGLAGTGALTGGDYSCAVLGCGVDICYPEENRKLYEGLKRQGCLVSEYPPGTMPQAKLFPPRNRLISGFADVVLVIEARKKSGTLITVDMALEQGKDVFVLPGRVTDSLSEGCNLLLNQGAGAALSPRTLLEYFFGEYEDAPFSGSSSSAKGSDYKESGHKESGCIERNPSLPPLEAALFRLLNEQDICPVNDLVAAGRERIGRDVSVREVMYGMSKLIRLGMAQEKEVGIYTRKTACSND